MISVLKSLPDGLLKGGGTQTLEIDDLSTDFSHIPQDFMLGGRNGHRVFLCTSGPRSVSPCGADETPAARWDITKAAKVASANRQKRHGAVKLDMGERQ